MTTLEAEQEYYRDQIREKGYVSVPSAASATDLERISGLFGDFMATCQDEGNGTFEDALTFVLPDRPKDGDYYVKRRIPGEKLPFHQDRAPGTDHKDVAQFGPLSMSVALSRLGNRTPRIMRDLLDRCVDLTEAAKASVRPVLGALGIEGLIIAEDSTENVHVVRLLHYLPSRKDHLGDLHFDRSVSTLALWESGPGLVGAPGNNTKGGVNDVDVIDDMALRANQGPIAHRSGFGKFFLGAGYNHLPADYQTQSDIPLLLHGVVNSEEQTERDSIVVFMNPELGFPHTVPPSHETGLSDMREYVERRQLGKLAVGY